MTKRFIQDIQPSKRIRAKIAKQKDVVIIPTRTEPEYVPEIQETPPPLFTRNDDIVKERIPDTTMRQVESRRPSRGWMLGVAVTCAIIFFLWAGGAVFGRAMIDIVPRSQIVPIPKTTFTALSVPRSTDDLQFHFTELEDSISAQIPATETESREVKASGKITIYNNHSTAPQRLSEETRFETPEGKIYKLGKGAPLTIPGMYKDGNAMVPGSIEAVVYAEKPGQEYNTELTDFTIPGFKGTPKYKNFYGRSKTAMTGGFVGQMSIISDETLVATKNRLSSELKERLMTQARGEIASTYIMYESGVSIVSEEAVVEDSAGKGVTIKQKGTLSALLFERAALGIFLAKHLLPGEEQGTFTVSNLDDISVSFANRSTFDLEKDTSITFSVQGEGKILWLMNDRLVDQIRKLTKNEVQQIFEKEPGIKQATVKFSPPWRRHVPGRSNHIEVIIHNPFEGNN